MRVVICAAEAPVEPLNGFRLQLDRLGAGLARKHDVTVLAAVPGDQPLPPLTWGELLPVRLRAGGFAAQARPTLSALLGRRPRAVCRATPPMAAAAASLLAEREFDLAQVSGPGLAGLAATLRPLPAVLSALDAWHLNVAAEARIAPPLKRPLYRLEERNIRRFSAREFGRFRRIVVVSDPDARALLELDSRLRIEVVPNGVDVEKMRPDPGVSPDPGLVVFTGAMHWAPNVEAARFLAVEVLPRLRARRPQARLAIVGRDPRREVLDLDRIPGVEVTGAVPDIRPWLWRAEAFACPMVSGTGIKNKLLEALACATACVATRRSCEGIRVVPGRDLLVADDAVGLADALASVLADAELRGRLARRGRDAVVAGHSWDSVVQAYERIYEQALTGDGPSRDRETPA